jgi:hypothetical protein
MDPISGEMSLINIHDGDKRSIIAILSRVPSSSEMNSWDEIKRQEMVLSPNRVVFDDPLSVEFHKSLHKLAYSMNCVDFPLLGKAVMEAITCYTSHRTSKSYNREALSENKVMDLLRKIEKEVEDPEISITGSLVATRNDYGFISSLVLLAGQLEIVLDLSWIEEEFGSIEDFYHVNRAKGKSKTGGEKVFVLCYQYHSWSVRNWATPISREDGESDIIYRTRVKSTLRDRNRFKVNRSTPPAVPNAMGLSESKSIYSHPNHLVAEIAMTLDTFYSYGNEAQCIAQSQQSSMLKPKRFDKDDIDRNDMFETAMDDTNKCYHLYQHSLSSYLILIGVLNFAANKIVEGVKAEVDEDVNMIDGNVEHEISAERNGTDRNVRLVIF